MATHGVEHAGPLGRATMRRSVTRHGSPETSLTASFLRKVHVLPVAQKTDKAADVDSRNGRLGQ